jgi:hypothetical protein
VHTGYFSKCSVSSAVSIQNNYMYVPMVKGGIFAQFFNMYTADDSDFLECNAVSPD